LVNERKYWQRENFALTAKEVNIVQQTARVFINVPSVI
jgi:hypothetical protein